MVATGTTVSYVYAWLLNSCTVLWRVHAPYNVCYEFFKHTDSHPQSGAEYNLIVIQELPHPGEGATHGGQRRTSPTRS